MRRCNAIVHKWRFICADSVTCHMSGVHTAAQLTFCMCCLCYLSLVGRHCFCLIIWSLMALDLLASVTPWYWTVACCTKWSRSDGRVCKSPYLIECLTRSDSRWTHVFVDGAAVFYWLSLHGGIQFYHLTATCCLVPRLRNSSELFLSSLGLSSTWSYWWWSVHVYASG